MKFIEVIIVDWYDNILKAFCKTTNGTIYYCCMLAMKQETNEKIYLCTEIAYLKGCESIIKIIKDDSFTDNWDYLHKLIVLKSTNSTQLIKAKNLREEDFECIDYKHNYKCPKGILWGDFPYFLPKAKKIDDWWSYF